MRAGLPIECPVTFHDCDHEDGDPPEPPCIRYGDHDCSILGADHVTICIGGGRYARVGTSHIADLDPGERRRP